MKAALPRRIRSSGDYGYHRGMPQHGQGWRRSLITTRRILWRRAPFYVVTLWAAVTLNFVIPRLMPGNPAELLLLKLQHLGRVTPYQLSTIAAEFGLNTKAGFWSQYASYLGDILHLRLGLSLTYYPETVSSVIAQTLPWTLGLVTAGTILSYALGVVLGIVLGWRRGSRIDSVITPGSMFFSAVPFFWVALMLVWIFGVSLGWLPIAGAFGISTNLGLTWGFAVSWLQHAILPIIAIVGSSLVGHYLHMRNMMVTTLGDDYILSAESKGLSRRKIKYAYAARNAVLPSIASFTVAIGFIFGGSILVETVFSYPGIGYALFQAVSNEDYPLMQGIFLIIVVAVLVANLAADVVYGIIDPRSAAQQSGSQS